MSDLTSISFKSDCPMFDYAMKKFSNFMTLITLFCFLHTFIHNALDLIVRIWYMNEHKAKVGQNFLAKHSPNYRCAVFALNEVVNKNFFHSSSGMQCKNLLLSVVIRETYNSELMT